MTDTDVERIQPKHNERFQFFSEEFKKNRLRYKEKDLEEERFDKDDAWTVQLCNFLKLTYDCSQC